MTAKSFFFLSPMLVRESGSMSYQRRYDFVGQRCRDRDGSFNETVWVDSSRSDDIKVF